MSYCAQDSKMSMLLSQHELSDCKKHSKHHGHGGESSHYNGQKNHKPTHRTVQLAIYQVTVRVSAWQILRNF